MKSIELNGLEILFSEGGQLLGLTQNGRCITGKKREDYFLQIFIDGDSYTDTGDFVFEKMETVGEALTVTWSVKGIAGVALHLESCAHFIRMYAEISDLTGGRESHEISDVTFQLPAVKYESIDTDRFHAPGQGACYELTSGNITFCPDAAVRDMRGFATEEDMYSTTPDKGAGLLMVEKEDGTACLGFTSYCDRENFYPMTRVEEDGIYLIQRDKLLFDLRRFPNMCTGNLYLFAGTYKEILRGYQRLLKEEIRLCPPQTPRWLMEGGILEVSPTQLGNFNDAVGRIDEFYELGIRTVYLMPCMKYERPSMYCTIDYFQIDEEFGGDAAFCNFVEKLHARGMRILMDLVPQGTSRNNKLVTEHPEWYEKDREGNLFPSHGWSDTRSMDWANPEVQQFFIDVACHYVKNFDVDGYRVDAPHWKEPNLEKNLPYYASYTCFGSVRLIRRMLRELTAIKLDVALLCEVWGAVFEDVTHAVCEYNIHWALYNGALQVFSGSKLQDWFSAYRYTQPEHSSKVVFLETHDTRLLTPPAQRLRGSGLTEALMDIAVFMGYQPMLWYGELERRADYYRKMLAWRKELAGELTGWADTEFVTAKDDQVFAAVRNGKRKMLLLVNFGNYPVQTELQGADEYFGLDRGRQYKMRNIHSSGCRQGHYMQGTGSDEKQTFTGGTLCEQTLSLEPCVSFWLAIEE